MTGTMPSTSLTRGTDALHVVARVGGERFAFRVADVEEALDAPKVLAVLAAPGGLVGQLRHREHTVPAFDSSWLFGIPRARTGGTALVLRLGERRLAVLVDDVDDLATLDVGALRPVPAGTDPDGLLRGLSVEARGGTERITGVVNVRAVARRAAGAAPEEER